MALTRKSLSAMGIEPEKIDQIVEDHSKTVSEIKEQKDALEKELEKVKKDAGDAAELQKELDKAKAEIDALDVEGLEKRFEDLKKEYADYKAAVESKAAHNDKENAYRDLLLKAGVSEKRIASVLKVSDVDGIEIEDGVVKDSDKLIEAIKSEWSDFIQTSGTKGAETANPPAKTGGNTFEALPLNEKMAYANEHPDDAEVKAWLGK